MQIVTFTAADPKMPYSLALFGQNSLQGCRNQGGLGVHAPTSNLGRSDNPISIMGADYTHHITTSPNRI